VYVKIGNCFCTSPKFNSCLIAFERAISARVGYRGAVSDVTRILQSIEEGDAKAAEELLPLVYDELRRLAAHKMSNEAAGQTLQPTALVHEAWLRLVGGNSQGWNDRQHFFRAAAEAMRHILVDRARQRRALRRGGDLEQTDLSDSKAHHPVLR